MAATTRLTYVLPATAVTLLILLAPARPPRVRMKWIGLWAAGAFVAALPALWVCLQAPWAAYFDNFRFPGLSTRYQAEIQGDVRATFASKLEYIQLILSRSLSLKILLGLTAAAIVAGLWPRQTATPAYRRFVCLVILLLAACAAAFIPTPIYHQYLYGPLPFAALAIGYGVARTGIADAWWSRIAFLALAAISCYSSANLYSGVARLREPASWQPNQMHREGKRLAALAGTGRVLTFYPGIALEAGKRIYPELSIGRYAIRSAHFLTSQERARLHVPDFAEVRGWFTSDPPSAVLVEEPASPLEARLVEFAVEHGYVRHPFGRRHMIYLPPDRNGRTE